MLSVQELSDYRKLDEPLKFINSNYITIKNLDRKLYSDVLDNVLQQLRMAMRDADETYKNFEGALHLAGSAFDKVKVGVPDEFDMNVVIKLPHSFNYTEDMKLTVSQPSFVTINVKSGIERFTDPSFIAKYQKALKLWTDSEGYLLQGSLHSWMEGVVTKALNKFPCTSKGRLITTKNNIEIYVKTKKSGPAMTLQCANANESMRIDVDLVPVLQFNNGGKSTFWPPLPVRQNSSMYNKTWSAIPKPKKSTSGKVNREWRMSFVAQEREIIERVGRVKNVIRQLKKLKSVHEETKNLPSYHVKTIFLWALEDQSLNYIWSSYSDGALFMFMLKRLLDHLVKGNIPFYWDKRNNLLDSVGSSVNNMRYKIERIIKDIINSSFSAEQLAKNMLTLNEYKDFIRRYNKENIDNSFERLSLDCPTYNQEAASASSRCCLM